MTARIVGLLLIICSAVALHCVTAGGAYCAKTARARAAAMGLNYPGDRGAPDLSGPPHYELHPQGVHHHFENNPQPPGMDYKLFYNPPQQLLHSKPAAHGSHSPVLASPLSRGESVNNHQSNFEQVKHVGPQTQARAPGQADLVDWVSGSHNKPLPFVYNWPDLAVDASVPNRHGMSVSGHSLPHIHGYGVYYLVYPAGAISKSDVAHPAVARQSQLPHHAIWPLYKKTINPRKQSYHVGRG